jgi:GntR family transcriptional regulator, galactonate operon transcriptional repressor
VPRPSRPARTAALETASSLGSRIVTGEIAPGSLLPKELELAEAHGVGRSTLREAVKILSAKGLLKATKRYGTQVCAKTDWNFLDPHVLQWYASVPAHVPDLLLSIIELRRALEPAIARLAARRATPVEAQDILARARALMDVLPASPIEHDIAFHLAVLRATHNLLFQALAPTYETLLRAQFQPSWSIMDKDPTYYPDERHLHFAEAVLARDAGRAERIARDMMGVSRRNVQSITRRLGLLRSGAGTAPDLRDQIERQLIKA